MINTNTSVSKYPQPAGTHVETVTDVEHYTDRLFRFRITRPPTFRFRSGEFVMIGLPNAEKPVFRAFQNDVFGAPTFVVNNNLFWGQDRLEFALDELNN